MNPGPERLPPLEDSTLDRAQRQAAERVISGPRGTLSGPFAVLLRDPELMDRVQHLGEYLRYGDALPQRLKEFAIVTTATHWRQRYEWYVHAPLALKAGVDPSTLAALPSGRPPRMPADEAVIYDFCTQLHTTRTVDDAVYASARTLLGETGVVALAALCGYYSLLAMTMNVARTSVPAGATTPFDPPSA